MAYPQTDTFLTLICVFGGGGLATGPARPCPVFTLLTGMKPPPMAGLRIIARPCRSAIASHLPGAVWDDLLRVCELR